MTTTDKRSKNIAIWLIASAAITLIALITKAWFSTRGGSGGVGLLGVEECFSGRCEGMTWFSIKRAPADIQLFSLIGILAVGAAIAMAIHTAVMLLKGTPDKVMKLAPVAIVAAIAAAIFFLRLEVSDISRKISVSWGFFATIAGLVSIAIAGKRAQELIPAAPASAFTAPPGQAMVPFASGEVPPMYPYPLALQMGMTRYYGHLFLAPGRLYFVCVQQGGAWMAAIGAGLGGALGAALANAAGPNPSGAPVVTDPEVLVRAVQNHPGSLIMEPPQIGVIKQTLFWRLIKWNGKTLGLPRGLGRDLKPAIASWARAHGVRTQGFA